MILFIIFALSAALVAVMSSSKLARRLAGAPALVLIVGAALSLIYRASGAPYAPVDWVETAAMAGLAALGFVSAAQFRISRLSRECPTSFRLTLGGAPLFLFACSLSAFIMLPQLSLPSALLLGAALMLNGAAFDRRAVINTSAPTAIKAAVRFESAAIIALGAPVAFLLAANATASLPGEPATAPLLQTSLAALKGFALGGVAGIAAALFGARVRKQRGKVLDGQIAIMMALIVFAVAPVLGAHPVIAAIATGLLWGEQTTAPKTTRLRMRRVVERSIAPAAYFAFGCLLAPRVLQADLLSIVFAIAAVTILRAGPRLAILQTPELPKESQIFLAWFGGAPGAASALFIIALLGNPALLDPDGVLTVGALAVTFGVLAARLTSKPLANQFLRQTALAKRRRMYAG